MPARIQYAPEFLAAIGHDGSAAVGASGHERKHAILRGYVTSAVETRLALPPQPVRDLTSALRGIRELVDEEGSALEVARKDALAKRTPLRIGAFAIATPLLGVSIAILTFTPTPPKGESDFLHAFASLAFLGGGLVGFLGLVADTSGIMKKQLGTSGFPLNNRRVADAAAALQAAPAVEEVAKLERWQRDVVTLLRTLTTEEGWAAVAEGARIVEDAAAR